MEPGIVRLAGCRTVLARYVLSEWVLGTDKVRGRNIQPGLGLVVMRSMPRRLFLPVVNSGTRQSKHVSTW